MEEDDMVMRVGNSLSTERRTDEEGRAVRRSYKEVPRLGGLAWQPPKDPLHCPPLR